MVWFPAKMMAAGFIIVLALMMVIPELKMNTLAITAMFTFAGALNLAIILPLGLMIIRGRFSSRHKGHTAAP